MGDAAWVAELLAEWAVGPATAIEPLKESRLWIVHFADGPPLVLKDVAEVAKAWSNSDFCAAVMTHLDAQGIGVPLPVRSAGAGGRPFVDWNGHRYTLARYQPAGRPPGSHTERVVLYCNVGREIARMHRALASYPLDGVLEVTWREDLVTGVAAWADALADVAPHAGAIVGPAQAAFREGLGEQLIHRDCHTSNVLVDGTKVVGFVDCDHFCVGPPVFDLAYYAIHLVKWEVDDPSATARWLEYLPALLDGFAATSAERAALPYAMAAVLMLFARAPHVRNSAAFSVEMDAFSWLQANLARVADVCR